MTRPMNLTQAIIQAHDAIARVDGRAQRELLNAVTLARREDLEHRRFMGRHATFSLSATRAAQALVIREIWQHVTGENARPLPTSWARLTRLRPSIIAALSLAETLVRLDWSPDEHEIEALDRVMAFDYLRDVGR